MKNVFKFGAVALSLTMAMGAHAASTWNVQFSGSGANDSLGDPIATTSYTNGGVTATLSGAYAADGTNSSGFASGSTWNTTSSGATVNYYSGYGLGMDSDGNQSPNHAIDNAGNTEAILLHFSTPVVLSQLGLGYISGDADVSILAYNGSATNPLSGVTAANTLTTSGWSLVGNYADLSVDTSNPYTAVNAAGTASSWWLISAYNTAFGTTSSNGGSLTEGNDYFKIFAVAGTTPATTGKTPEPGSLALAGLALVGAAWTRRRNRKA